MTTRRQIDANRRNARSSTGPRSAAGKAAASLNALRHGLTAAHAMVLPDESADAFARFRDGVIDDLAPQGMLQAALAQRIALLLWRLDRAARLEAELFVHGRLVARRDRLHAERSHDALDALLRAGCRAAGEAVDEEAEAILDKATTLINEQIRAEAPSAKLLVEYEASARVHERLMRHEGALQRALNRTLEDFWRLRDTADAAPQADPDAGAAEADADESLPHGAGAGAPHAEARACDEAADAHDDAVDEACDGANGACGEAEDAYDGAADEAGDGAGRYGGERVLQNEPNSPQPRAPLVKLPRDAGPPIVPPAR